jgi:hypothetical protein
MIAVVEVLIMPGSSSSDVRADGRAILLERRPIKAGYCVLEESLLQRGETYRGASSFHFAEVRMLESEVT